MKIIIILSSLFLGVYDFINSREWSWKIQYGYDLIWDLIINIGIYMIPLFIIYRLTNILNGNAKYRSILIKHNKKLVNLYETLTFSIVSINSLSSKIIFLFLLTLFVYLHYYYPEYLFFNISFNIIALVISSILSKKNISESDAINKFKKDYFELYETIGNTVKDFGEKYVGMKYKDLPDGYIDWLASENFTFRKANVNKQKFIIAKNYAKFKQTKQDLLNLRSNKQENSIDITINPDTLLKIIFGV